MAVQWMLLKSSVKNPANKFQNT